MSPPIATVSTRGFTLPTDAPESDGTFAWKETSLVVVEVTAGGEVGLGYTYADRSTATLIETLLAKKVVGREAGDIGATWDVLRAAVRNLGRSGIAAMAISAIDVALWDLKGKLLGVPTAQLLGVRRQQVPLYGSGGFTSYDDAQLTQQLGGWVDQGFCAVKMKVGREPERDPARVATARRAIGDRAQLFVDANGAQTARQAITLAERFAEQKVSWFEEPVSSDDLAGLAQVRARAPAGMEIAAGEYAYDPLDVLRLLQAGAVDVIQADASRIGGYTGFLRAAALADVFGIALSAHCAPALHLHVAAAVPRLRHVEWFHDHARIEALAFDGAPLARGGTMTFDPGRAGIGLALRESDLARYAW